MAGLRSGRLQYYTHCSAAMRNRATKFALDARQSEPDADRQRHCIISLATQQYGFAPLFLRWRHGRRIAGGGAEDAGIVLLRAAVAFELVGIPAKCIGLAQIAKNPASIGVIDDGQCLLRRLAEAIEGGA